MRFRQFFEATLQNLAAIKNHIDEKSGRPFEELFKGRDRFMVKVYNPDLTKSAKNLGLDIDEIDLKKRKYKGSPISTFLRERKNKLKDKIPSKLEALAEYKRIYKKELEELLVKSITALTVVRQNRR
jgi:hypothetical protein